MRASRRPDGLSPVNSPSPASQESATRLQFKLLRVPGDGRGMRLLLLFSLAFCLSVSSGCMVIEELDKAAALLPENQRNAEQSDAPESDGASAAHRSKQELIEASKRWWRRATSLSPEPVKSSIVSCRFRERMLFMSKDDCLLQGGRPGSVSG